MLDHRGISFTLTQLGMLVLAAILISTFAVVYFNYRRGVALRNFERDAERLADRLRSLAYQGVGTVDYFNINVPENCELRFEGESVVAILGNDRKAYETGVAINGPTLPSWAGQLTLTRTRDGVQVSIG